MGSPGDAPYRIQCDETPPGLATTAANLESFLKDKFGHDYNILFHLDEHRKICPRDLERNDTGVLFSKGVMLTLANMPMVTVIATYVTPPLLPPQGSSMVCRYPVPLPRLDLQAAIEHIPELQFEKLDGLEKKNRRLFATLYFRLGMVLQYKYGLRVLHCHSNTFKVELLEPFNKFKRNCDMKKALMDCAEISLCHT